MNCTRIVIVLKQENARPGGRCDMRHTCITKDYIVTQSTFMFTFTWL